MERVLSLPLAVLNRVRLLRWRLTLRYLTARYGIRLQLDLGDGIQLADIPRLKIIDTGQRGGTLTIRLGDHVQIGSSVEFETTTSGTNVLDIGASTQISTSAHFKVSDGTIRVGASSQLRDYLMMKSSGLIEVGPDVTISYGAVIHCMDLITFERGVGIAENVTIVDCEHVFESGEGAWFEVPVASTPVLLGRNATVLANSTVRMGTILGEGCAVGANSVVGGEFPPNSLIVGAPAKLVRRLAVAPDGAVAQSL